MPKGNNDEDKISLDRAKEILRRGEQQKLENQSRWKRMRQKARNYVKSLKDDEDSE